MSLEDKDVHVPDLVNSILKDELPVDVGLTAEAIQQLNGQYDCGDGTDSLGTLTGEGSEVRPIWAP